MVISVEVLVLCLFSLYLVTSTGPRPGYISWCSRSMLIFFSCIYVYRSQTWLYQLRILFYVCYLCIYSCLLFLNMVISVEVLALCLFSLYIFTPPCLNHVDVSWGSCFMLVFFLYLFTSTGPKHGYISWGSSSMFIFFAFIYVYWSYTRLYQLRFSFYVCFLCIYLRLLVLNMVISVEDLVLCLFSLYLFTSTGPKHGYISWGSCSMFVFFVFIYVYWS